MRTVQAMQHHVCKRGETNLTVSHFHIHVSGKFFRTAVVSPGPVDGVAVDDIIPPPAAAFAINSHG